MPIIPIRPIRIEGNIAYVTLTKGYEAIIDADDVFLVDKWNWYASIQGNTVYASRSFMHNGSRVYLSMHRAIMKTKENLHVDHKDGNGLNNRKSNLRLASRSQNMRNMKIRKDNASGSKGVSCHKQREKWAAYINVNGKRKNLGLHETVEKASAAYKAASLKFHGDFGRTH